jgi:4-amino-4-deoxy-L-arabinose transferase-like glycosyltransferase
VVAFRAAPKAGQRGEDLQRRSECPPVLAVPELSRVEPPIAIIGLVVFSWLAATAWMRALTLPDEGRYVGVAWEMVRSGNWLVPTLDTLPYFHKPPLFYWLTACAISLLGNNEWAARLPTLIAATCAALGLFAFLRRWCSESTAATALLVLATTPYFFFGAQFANLDMLVAACITGSILCSAHVILCLRHQHGSSRRALMGAYIFAALAVLAKGLIGVVIPALVIGAWLLLGRDLRLIRRLLCWQGVALFAAVAVPWFALMEVQYPGFLEYFFIHHHLERYLTADFNGKEPFWFYAPVFVAITLPWSAFLPWAFRRRHGETVQDDVRLLSWIWLVAPIVFFSIPQSKLLGYVLPATPALAVLVAQALTHKTETWLARRRSVIGNATVGAVVCLVGVMAYALYHPKDSGGLAAKIRSQLRSDHRLLAISQYPFSASFYLRSKQPFAVIENWHAPIVQLKDNWRKELYEAGKFDSEREKPLLLLPPQLEETLCAGTTWVFGTPRDSDRLKNLRLIVSNDKARVWLAEPNELNCPAKN